MTTRRLRACQFTCRVSLQNALNSIHFNNVIASSRSITFTLLMFIAHLRNENDIIHYYRYYFIASILTQTHLSSYDWIIHKSKVHFVSYPIVLLSVYLNFLPKYKKKKYIAGWVSPGDTASWSGNYEYGSENEDVGGAASGRGNFSKSSLKLSIELIKSQIISVSFFFLSLHVCACELA